jgi:hypothetical protein
VLALGLQLPMPQTTLARCQLREQLIVLTG